MSTNPWWRSLLSALGVAAMVAIRADDLSAARVASPRLRSQLQTGSAAATPTARTAATTRREFLNAHCIACHNSKLKTAGLVLESIDAERVGVQAEIWEKVLRKVRSGQMPPSGRPQPDRQAATLFGDQLAAALDNVAAAAPNPGRPAVHRLNRGEYVNAIRDLLDLEIDGRALLPPDDSGLGFDNNADVLTMSPA